MDRLSELKIPATLTGLVQARLDSLQTNTRETLQQASVVGRIFWTQVVARMQNPESQPVQQSIPIDMELQTLRAKELIFQYGDSAPSKIPEFIFKNAILHNVTYESVLLRLRPVYHQQAAEGLIEISGERINEYAGRVGEHYELAETSRKLPTGMGWQGNRPRSHMKRMLRSVITRRLWIFSLRRHPMRTPRCNWKFIPSLDRC